MTRLLVELEREGYWAGSDAKLWPALRALNFGPGAAGRRPIPMKGTGGRPYGERRADVGIRPYEL